MREPTANPIVPLPEELRAFVAREPWTFARTYAETWPHEYLVRERVGSRQLFVQFWEHIRNHGYEANFYAQKIIYFDEGGLTYWTTGAPVAETTIINRCPKESTYEAMGQLAKPPGTQYCYGGLFETKHDSCETISEVSRKMGDSDPPLLANILRTNSHRIRAFYKKPLPACRVMLENPK